MERAAEAERRYESVEGLADYYARGVGWVRDRLGMVLTIVVAAGNGTEGELRPPSSRAGPVHVFLVDVVGSLRCGGGNGSAWFEYHPP